MPEAFSSLGTGFSVVFGDPLFFGLLLIGLVLGLAIGVLPGVGGTTGVAILLPLTLIMPPAGALAMLGAIYWGAMYGGTIASIIFGVPGNPWSVATMFDGRPLAMKGLASYALATAFGVSFFGAIVSSLFFVFFALPFADLALRFQAPEILAVMLIAFGTFVGMGGHPLKQLTMMAVGFLLATVGLDIVTGQPRLNFGTQEFMQGFHFVPVTIALYGLGEVLANASERYKIRIEDLTRASSIGLSVVGQALKGVLRHIRLVIGSSFLGTFIGVLPGVGATPASFIGYGLAQRYSKDPSRFGTGAPEGVMAPETANNAAGTSSLLPMLVLGIPGSPTAAVIMAGIFMWGFMPGPRLFTEEANLVWAFIASLFVANAIAVTICTFGTPVLVSILKTPYALLTVIIVLLSIMGTWAIRFSAFDLLQLAPLALLGFLFRKLGFPMAPLVVALVLGFRTETALRQTLLLGDGSPLILFTKGPMTATLTTIAIIFFLLPVLMPAVRRLGFLARRS